MIRAQEITNKSFSIFLVGDQNLVVFFFWKTVTDVKGTNLVQFLQTRHNVEWEETLDEMRIRDDL
jgi:hypothetical protein